LRKCKNLCLLGSCRCYSALYIVYIGLGCNIDHTGRKVGYSDLYTTEYGLEYYWYSGIFWGIPSEYLHNTCDNPPGIRRNKIHLIFRAEYCRNRIFKFVPYNRQILHVCLFNEMISSKSFFSKSSKVAFAKYSISNIIRVVEICSEILKRAWLFLSCYVDRVFPNNQV
jgi:hypothetical protein